MNHTAFIKKLEENYHLHRQKPQEKERCYGSTKCVQYGSYESTFYRHFEEEIVVTSNGDIISTTITEEEVLENLFSGKEIDVIDTKHLGCSIVGQSIIFSIPGYIGIDENNTPKEVLEKEFMLTFAKVSLFDNLNVNRWEFEDRSCDIFLEITVSPDLKKVSKA